jgi:pyrimidine-specific ribonucleoside hydrolase
MPKKQLLPLALALMLLGPATVLAQKSQPIPIIFDTDMGPDYDDVGAITILHTYADSGKVSILATMASDRYEGVAAVLSVFNTYFRRPNIPIGIPGDKAPNIRDKQHWTDSILAGYPHAVHRNAEAADAVTLYRKILAKQPNHSVVIVTVGFQTNLAGILASRPDGLSPLDGIALVRKKVRLLVCMAGASPRGNEFNINRDIPAAQAVAKDWPTPIIYSGFEIGKKIHTGIPLIHNAAIGHSPVKDVFRICIPLSAEDSIGRMSWDETAVFVAINGYAPWYKLQPGHISIAPDGSNTWEDSPDGNERNGPGSRSYLVEALPPSTVEQLINQLIMHQPKP